MTNSITGPQMYTRIVILKMEKIKIKIIKWRIHVQSFNLNSILYKVREITIPM